jgi:prophage antirepressor-like protein
VASTALTPFHYGDEQVRTYEEDDEIWFIATDVARVLGYGDATHMTRGLDSDEVRLHIVETRAGSRSVSTVSLAGLFHVLNTARVEAARPFKRWVNHEVLPSIYRTGSYSLLGAAPSPSAEDPALARAKGLMELVALAKDVISPDYLEAKARIVLARAMGDTPEIEASARPLYVQDYMREQGVSSDNIKSYGPTFGKYVKKAYKAERGVEPGKRFDETPSGQVREVCVYTEADRPIFDRAWSESYAKGFPEKRDAKKNKEKK